MNSSIKKNGKSKSKRDKNVLKTEKRDNKKDRIINLTTGMEEEEITTETIEIITEEKKEEEGVEDDHIK